MKMETGFLIFRIVFSIYSLLSAKVVKSKGNTKFCKIVLVKSIYFVPRIISVGITKCNF